MPLYQRILGSAWSALPAEIRALHDGRGIAATGRCDVQRGYGMASRLVATLFRFPASGDDVPITVAFKRHGADEEWIRTFGKKAFSSRLREGTGTASRLLCECFGPFVFAQALVVDDRGLRLVVRHWSAFGIALPLWLGPISNSRVTVREGRYRFFVDISHPWIGLIVRYQGWLTHEVATTENARVDGGASAENAS